MFDNFATLKAKIGKLEGNLDGRALSRKRIHAETHKIFPAEDVTKYERILSVTLVLSFRYRALQNSYFPKMAPRYILNRR